MMAWEKLKWRNDWIFQITHSAEYVISVKWCDSEMNIHNGRIVSFI